jgi:predicted flap endonuclease-1-like 5' DNA nuclease
MKIEDIEGIGAKFAEKMKAAAVQTTEDLLEKGGTSAGRAALAAAVELTEKQILEWVNRADLYRIKGIGSEYADLLEAAGVDTVMELARRDANNLFEKLKATNDEKKKVRDLPSADQVAKWVEQAKSLPRAVEY